MVAKSKLSKEAYNRQISGLIYPESKGDKAKNYNVAVKVDLATRDKIKTIPNWQNKLREAIAELIEREKTSTDETNSSAA